MLSKKDDKALNITVVVFISTPHPFPSHQRAFYIKSSIYNKGIIR